MCDFCQDNNSNNNWGSYVTNIWNPNSNQPGNMYSCTPQRPCNGCINIIKGECVLYTGTNLTNLGIATNDDFNTVLAKLDEIKRIQDLKNANILLALNDLNDRLVTESGIDHDPYVLI